jgi:uncharacterized protein (TIGR02453 family)
MANEFNGFSPSFLRFFRELSKNNNREWFKANKVRFQKDVQAPMSDFIAALAPRLEKVSPHYVADPRPNGGSMFRIYRDMRFSKDKKPYKENAGVHLRHARGKDAHAPGFYIHLSPKDIFYGGGIWYPPSPHLKKIREAIRDDPGAWKKVATNKRILEQCGGVEGIGLTCPPRGFDEDMAFIEDIKRKSFFAMQSAKPKSIESPEFLKEVHEAMKTAKPLMKFVCDAIDVPF